MAIDSSVELYGANAITTSPEEGRQIEIQSTTTNQFTAKVNADGTPSETVGEPQGNLGGQSDVKPEGNPDDSGGGEPTEESQAETALAGQLEANRALISDLTSKGVDFTAIEAEYQATGEVGEVNRAALEKAGYPKPVVDSYINGLKATAEQFANSVYKVSGGKEVFETARDFVKAQGQVAINAFNSAIESGNVNQIGMVVQGINAQMVAAKGTVNPSLIGTKTTLNVPQGFRDKAEMVHAMSDKRYGRDPGYTKAVEQKVLLTNF